MDDNEEMVECRWCNELYDTGELKIEKGLGPVCDYCIAAIKSRGERMFLSCRPHYARKWFGTEDKPKKTKEA